jgi:hypothetical protein
MHGVTTAPFTKADLGLAVGVLLQQPGAPKTFQLERPEG